MENHDMKHSIEFSDGVYSGALYITEEGLAGATAKLYEIMSIVT